MSPQTADKRLGLSVLLPGAGGAHIVAAGELDIETAPALAETLVDAAARTRRVMLDLAAVTFLDPAAAGVICSAIRSSRAHVAVTPPANRTGGRLLEVLRLEHALAA